MPPVQRLCAPASLATELRANDPPTGNPPENAAAMLATPWLRNSRFGSHGSRSWAAKVRAMAAGSAKPTRAMTMPGTSSSESELHGKLADSGGNPSGMLPIKAPV